MAMNSWGLKCGLLVFCLYLASTNGRSRVYYDTEEVDFTFMDLERSTIPYYFPQDSLELKIKFSRSVGVTVICPITDISSETFPLIVIPFEEPERWDEMPYLLAQRGMIVGLVELDAPSTSTDYVSDILFVLGELAVESTYMDSPVYGKFNGHLGFLAFGIAAEAALWTALRETEFPEYLDAINNVNWEWDGYVVVAPRYVQEGVLMSMLELPPGSHIMFLVGETDCEEPAADNSTPLYGQVAAHVCKSLVSAVEGSRCFYDTPTPVPSPAPAGQNSCYNIELECGAEPSILPEQQRIRSRPIMLDFIDHMTSGNMTLWDDYYRGGLEDNPEFDFFMECRKNGTLFTGTRAINLG